jgi:hypothetical protein
MFFLTDETGTESAVEDDEGNNAESENDESEDDDHDESKSKNDDLAKDKAEWKWCGCKPCQVLEKYGMLSSLLCFSVVVSFALKS